MEVVGCTKRGVKNFETNILRFNREKLEGVHDEIGGGTGEDPCDGISLFFLGLWVNEVIKLFLHD